MNTFITYQELTPFLKLSKFKINNWLKKVNYQPEELLDEKYIDFDHFIDLYVIKELRASGLSLQKIIKARNELSEILNIEYPFSYKNIMTDGKTVFTELDKSVLNLNGSKQYISDIIKDFVKKIDYNKDDFAYRIYPFGRKIPVVIDKNKYKHAVIEGTAINPIHLYNYFRAGDSVRALSKAFDIDENKLNKVIEAYTAA